MTDPGPCIMTGKDAYFEFNLYKFIETFHGQPCDLSWRMVHMLLKRICTLLFLEKMFSMCVI